MKDLCIPIPKIGDGQQAEVLVFVGNEKLEYHFRVESFPWDSDDDLQGPDADDLELSLARISRLKQSIKNYDNHWELIQIFNPSENAKFIQVLYRKKM